MKFKAMDHTSKTNDVKILLQTTLIWRVATGKRNLNANIYIYIYIYITYYLLLITYYLLLNNITLEAEGRKKQIPLRSGQMDRFLSRRPNFRERSVAHELFKSL